MQPKVRNNEELIVRRVGNELVVYDLKRDQGHALNSTATFIFEQCDGQTTIDQMAARMAVELNIPHAEHVTALALQRLSQANLLVGYAPNSAAYALSRRDVLKLAGKAGLAATMLPVVTSLLVPSAAQAQSAIVPPDNCQACQDAYNACIAGCQANPVDPGTSEITCEEDCMVILNGCLSSNGCL